MSPTVFRYKNYRFFFFSLEEPRMHIHVVSPDGEAKIWVEPVVEMDRSVGYNTRELNEVLKQVQEHQDEITEAWHKHFS